MAQANRVNRMDECVQALKERDMNTERYFFKLGDIKYDNDLQDGEMVNRIESEDFTGTLSDAGFETLCEMLRVPKVYAKRCPPTLARANINHWLKENKGDGYSALVESGKIRTFMNPAYPYISTHDVLEAVVGEIPKEFVLGNYHLDEEAMEAVILTPDFDQTVIDSPVYGGLRIVHSDSWNIFPDLDAYLLREICTNGMTSPLEHKKLRVSGKSSEEILTKLRSYTKESLANLPKMFEGFIALNEQKVANMVAIISKIVQENRLPKYVKTELVETLSDPSFLHTIDDLNTMHGVANLLTYVGSHSRTMNSDHRESLMRIAGNMALHNSIRCGSCGGSVS